MNMLQDEAFARAEEMFKRAKFAPGDYCNRCIDCQWIFAGDKLAQRCFSCAAELIANASADADRPKAVTP
jgi:ribosomal protein S27E